jgi:hypothetical protein
MDESPHQTPQEQDVLVLAREMKIVCEDDN